jgi:AcrR family transcriptional regulator
MTSKSEQTRLRILASAKKDFLENGFSGASLRTIAKNAGVTTGALYGYFSDKDALFDALVGEHVAFFHRIFREAQMAFREMDSRSQIDEMHKHSEKTLIYLTEYMYGHFDAFRLVICGASGSRFENWLEPLISIEEESTALFIKSLKKAGYPVKDISKELIHILCSGFFHGIMETIAHRMNKPQAMTHIAHLREFSAAGWNALLGIR